MSLKRIREKNGRRARRRVSIRKKLTGTPERPRVTVYRSNRYTYVQAVDDQQGHTLVAASNKETEHKVLRNTVGDLAKLGEAFGKRLVEKDIRTVVFDRNGYKYHGRIKALADGLRKSGIQV